MNQMAKPDPITEDAPAVLFYRLSREFSAVGKENISNERILAICEAYYGATAYIKEWNWDTCRGKLSSFTVTYSRLIPAIPSTTPAAD